MLNTTRSRVRALAVVGMAAVVGTIGTIAFQANAAEVPAAAPAAAPAAVPAAGAVPAAVLPAAPGVAGARAVAVPTIPAELRPPAGSRPIGAFIVADGTQNYTCVVPDGAATGAFTGASTPEAQLIGTGGRIHHFAGPSWQSERDQSLVVGGARVAVSQPGTIPWLLITAAKNSESGLLSKADYISRLYTSGGAAPTRSCTAGEVEKVKYNAVYVFWDAPPAASTVDIAEAGSRPTYGEERLKNSLCVWVGLRYVSWSGHSDLRGRIFIHLSREW